MSTDTTASVSTHVLDTSSGRPAGAVAVSLAARGGGGDYATLGGSTTGEDGRCEDLPALPEGTTHVRLAFDTGSYFTGDGQAGPRQAGPRAGGGGVFFPEVVIAFAVTPGEHFHVPLLLNPFGYSVYRGS